MGDLDNFFGVTSYGTDSFAQVPDTSGGYSSNPNYNYGVADISGGGGGNEFANFEAMNFAAQIAQQAATMAMNKEIAQLQAKSNEKIAGIGAAASRYGTDAQLKASLAATAVQKAQEKFNEVMGIAQTTGMYNGSPTWQRVLDEAGMTGLYQGKPTWERTYQTSQLSGYMSDGTNTLARDTLEQQTALAYLNLMKDLRGPANAFQMARVLNGTPQGIYDILRSATGEYAMPGVGGGNPDVATERATLGNFLGNMVNGQMGTITPPYDLSQQQGGAQPVVSANRGTFPPVAPPPVITSQNNPFLGTPQAPTVPLGVPTAGPTTPTPPPPPAGLTQAQWNQILESQANNTGGAAWNAAAQASLGQTSSTTAQGSPANLDLGGTYSGDPYGRRDHGMTPEERGTLMAQYGIDPEDYSGKKLGRSGEEWLAKQSREAHPTWWQQADGSWTFLGAPAPEAAPGPPAPEPYQDFDPNPNTYAAPTSYVSPAGVEAPNSWWNYEPNGQGGTTVYPPGTVAPITGSQVSTQTPNDAYATGGGVATLSGLPGATIPPPNQWDPSNINNMTDYQKQLLGALYEDAGWDPTAAWDTYTKSLPKVAGPSYGSVQAFI